MGDALEIDNSNLKPKEAVQTVMIHTKGMFKDLKFLTIKHVFLLALAIIPIFVIFPSILIIDFNKSSLFYINNQSKLVLASFSVVAFLVILHAEDIYKCEILSILFYTFSSFAVVLACNTILLLIFFEFMVLGTFFIIASNRRKNNIGPVVRYTIIHFFAGTLILSAVAMQLSEFNSNMIFHSVLNFQNIQLQDNISYIIALLGLLINCGSFPFSYWVVDSYPEATLHSTPYLSIFTTKVSSYILLLMFHGSEILFYFGLVTAFYAVVFAVLENNMRRLLCYNLIGQTGLIITGIGFSNKYAEAGIILQIIFCTIYQSLLFIIVNSIIIRTKKHNLNEIGNLLKKMPIEAICSFVAISTMVGAFGTPTFISKSLITLNTLNSRCEMLFLFANLMLFVSVGLKFFYFAFIYKRKRKIVERGDIKNFAAMSILSIVCILSGIFYNQYLPYLLEDIPIFYQSKKILINVSTVACCIMLFIFLRNLFCLKIAFNLNLKYFLSYVLLLCDRFILFVVNGSVNLVKSTILSYGIKLYAIESSSNVTVILATVIINVLLIFLCLNRLLMA